jgi:hypothetical protein
LKFEVVVSRFDEDLDKAQFPGGAGEFGLWMPGQESSAQLPGNSPVA